MDNAIETPANRAARRAQAAQGLPISPKGVTRKPEPIRWVKMNNNTESCSFGPWVVSVRSVPVLSAMDPPSYAVTVEAGNVSAQDIGIHDETKAKVLAVRLLATMLKAGIQEMVKHGVISVRGDAQPGPGRGSDNHQHQ